jgi:hypothetical protein
MIGNFFSPNKRKSDSSIVIDNFMVRFLSYSEKRVAHSSGIQSAQGPRVYPFDLFGGGLFARN